jgi:NAD(P)-dependent dehydrogenase (short-subunit alcohol dehydrogenase family)
VKIYTLGLLNNFRKELTMGRLEGKVAIVTGSGSGIGRASAIRFAEEGAKVVVADWSEEWGGETVSTIKAAGGEAVFVKTDVSNEDDVKKMVKTAVDTYGKLNIIFNNAGILEIEDVAITDCKAANFDKVISVNLRSVFLGIKYAIPEMLKAGGGSIVNTASGAARDGWPHIPAYSAAKGGITALSRQVTADFITKNIRSNCILPGLTKTRLLDDLRRGNPEAFDQLLAMEPSGRFGTPEEIANVALFLASDESSYMSGAELFVGAGLYTVTQNKPRYD